MRKQAKAFSGYCPKARALEHVDAQIDGFCECRAAGDDQDEDGDGKSGGHVFEWLMRVIGLFGFVLFVSFNALA